MRAAALPTPPRRAQRLPWLALMLALAVMLPQSVASAQLPLHLQWLPSILPPAAVGPALKDFFQNMPTELCALGPKGISGLPVSVMDEVGVSAQRGASDCHGWRRWLLAGRVTLALADGNHRAVNSPLDQSPSSPFPENPGRCALSRQRTAWAAPYPRCAG
jgi:hypothetical protein